MTCAYRINPSQASLVHSLLAFRLEIDVIELHLVRTNQIPRGDLIVIADMKIHLLIVYFFFVDCNADFVVENWTELIPDIFCARFVGSHSMEGKHFYFNVCVHSPTNKFHG